MLKIKDLLPDEANFNTGTEFGNSLIDKSLSKFGAGRSILIDKNNRIIAGNKTIENAAANGFDDVVIVETTGEQIVAVKRTDIDLNTKKGREMALADNATAKANISWDAQTLTEWDMPLQEWGIDLTDITEVEPAGESDAEPQIDKAAELNKKWGVVSGDLWQIGEHRLLCGDSTDAANAARLLDGNKVDVTFTSPPYNANVKMGNYYVIDGKRTRVNEPLYMDNDRDNMASDEYISFCNTALTICFEHTEGFIFWNVGYNANARWEYIDGVYPFRDRLRETIVWKKNALPVANGFTRNFEFIFLFATNGGNVNEEYDTTHCVWEVSNAGAQDADHKACFPVELPAKALGLSRAFRTVFEPFAGSGTTLVACQNLNRKCYAIEISENYCAVILERMATAFPELEIKRIDA